MRCIACVCLLCSCDKCDQGRCLDCLGLAKRPPGKWYCSDCTSAAQREQERRYAANSVREGVTTDIALLNGATDGVLRSAGITGAKVTLIRQQLEQGGPFTSWEQLSKGPRAVGVSQGIVHRWMHQLVRRAAQAQHADMPSQCAPHRPSHCFSPSN